jgi:putative hydrolase of HD superfamily
MPLDRITAQIAFLAEVEKLKAVVRRTRTDNSSRQENSAEHSWHVLLSAIVLREYAAVEVDLLHTLEMLGIHDLVEIDAGDTFAYDRANQETKAQREQAAADRIFSLLPPDQASYFRALWDEFEGQRTPESCFANAIDRLLPLLQNARSGGGSWRTHAVTRDQVLTRMAPIESTLPALWPMVADIIDEFAALGVLQKA